MHSHWIAVGICVYFVILGVVYAAVTPPFEAPDEASHFLYIHNLLETGQLPILEARNTMFNSQSVQRHHPPLYYLIGGALISWTERGDVETYLQPNPLGSIGTVTDNNQNVYLHPIPVGSGDTALAIWVLRLYSLTLGAGTIWFIYKAAALLSSSPAVGLLAALFAASIPSFIHISASINNDNLVTLFHAAGVCVGLRIWKRRIISRNDIIVVCLILSGVALTKINGLTLLPILLGWLLFGAASGRLRWRSVLRLFGVSLLSILLLAGWWYIRNQQLYGDPLALTATLSIWSRGGAPQLISLFEAKGVWDSFWFTLGHLNIRGPEWLYSLYLPLVAVLGFIGIAVAFFRQKSWRIFLIFMIGIGLIAVVALLVASSRINVSQGRILFPGLIAYVPLLVIGWTSLLGKRLGGIVVLPLAGLAVAAPFLYLAPAFTPAVVVEALPADAYPLHITSDAPLTIEGYQLQTETMKEADEIRLTLFIGGFHPDNPYLFVKALHPVTNEVLGGADVYPGMMPTNTLSEGLLYAVPIHFRLDTPSAFMPENPYQINLALGWRIPDADDSAEGQYVPLRVDGEDTTTAVLPGPIYFPHQPPNVTPEFPADVTYGGLIRLSGYTLSGNPVSPGQTLTVRLFWDDLAPIDEDWSVAVGLLDAESNIAVQADGMPLGYPTSAWQPGLVFTDVRPLVIPGNLVPGQYRLYIGWYRLSDGERLQPSGAGVSGSLYIHHRPIIVQ
jgi:hypothetical protein